MNVMEKLAYSAGLVVMVIGGYFLDSMALLFAGMTLSIGAVVLKGIRLKRESKPYLAFLQSKGLIHPEKVLKRAASQMRREGGVWQGEEAAKKLFNVRTVTTPSPLWSILGAGGFDPPQGK